VISAALFAVQTDPAIVEQLERLVTTQIVVAVAFAVMGLAVLGVAVGALLTIRKVTRILDRTTQQLSPRVDPILTNLARISDDAQDVAGALKYRLNDVLATVEDLNIRLREGADSVEKRVRQLGTVVDVVQTETEDMLLDAASAARGVHTASQVLRGGRAALPPDLEDDEFDEEEEDDEYIR
jgi:methyl-accepting chemotaxis protein